MREKVSNIQKSRWMKLNLFFKNKIDSFDKANIIVFSFLEKYCIHIIIVECFLYKYYVCLCITIFSNQIVLLIY